MYAVQVMNFLMMLILKTLKARQEPTVEDASTPHSDPSDKNGHHSPQLSLEVCSNEAVDQVPLPEDPILDGDSQLLKENVETHNAGPDTTQKSQRNALSEEITDCSDENGCDIPPQTGSLTEREEAAANSSASVQGNARATGKGKSSNKKEARKSKGPSSVRSNLQADKSKGTSITTHINSKTERIEAWR